MSRRYVHFILSMTQHLEIFALNFFGFVIIGLVKSLFSFITPNQALCDHQDTVTPWPINFESRIGVHEFSWHLSLHGVSIGLVLVYATSVKAVSPSAAQIKDWDSELTVERTADEQDTNRLSLTRKRMSIHHLCDHQDTVTHCKLRNDQSLCRVWIEREFLCGFKACPHLFVLKLKRMVEVSLDSIFLYASTPWMNSNFIKTNPPKIQGPSHDGH